MAAVLAANMARLGFTSSVTLCTLVKGIEEQGTVDTGVGNDEDAVMDRFCAVLAAIAMAGNRSSGFTFISRSGDDVVDGLTGKFTVDGIETGKLGCGGRDGIDMGGPGCWSGGRSGPP